MSRRPILLVTTMCLGLASIAAIGPAPAHGSWYNECNHHDGYYSSEKPVGPCQNVTKRPIAPQGLWVGPGAHVTKPSIAPQGLPGVGPGALVTKPSIATLGSGGWHGGR
jgi:hypothetical protein